MYVRKSSFTAPLVCTLKLDFWQYIRHYTSPNENFEYSYLHSNALLQFRLKLEHCKPHKGARHPMKCDLINEVKLFPTVSQSFDVIQSNIALQKQVH